MAEKKKKTLRQKRDADKGAKKSRRLSSAKSKIGSPIKKAARRGSREFHVFKLPNNRFGRILGRRVNIIPKYFRESWSELRKVTWPTRNETVNLSIAVFIFTVVLTGVVAVLDFGLDKIFKELII